MPSNYDLLDNRLFRSGLGLLLIVTFSWAMIHSGRIAISRIFTKYGTTVLGTAPTDAAAAVATSASMTPKDAEVHYTRGAVATYQQETTTAISEYEQAISLKPKDYYFWIELGLARDSAGDQEGALFAFNESMRLAPYYAQPRWNRGQLLFRMQKYDEAFNDLRLATKSNPEYLSALIDLAWNASRKDPTLTKQILQLENDKGQAELALFFAKQGKPDDSVREFTNVKDDPTSIRHELVRTLISNGAIKQAFQIWTGGKDPNGNKSTVYDGGLEGALSLDESGFGWRLAPTQPGVTFSVDGGQPQRGNRSLRITFTGLENPSLELVSQLIVIEPGSRYQLNFSIRTEKLVTGGPLVVVVKDVNSQQLLARSASFPADTKGWQTLSTEFATGKETTAVRIALQRQECSTSPCPVFGTVNLDSFSLEALKPQAAR
jgi:hypothetical protein